jgi:hypothetical protein
MLLLLINLANLFFMGSAILLFREYFWEIRTQQWKNKPFKNMKFQQFVHAEAI